MEFKVNQRKWWCYSLPEKVGKYETEMFVVYQWLVGVKYPIQGFKTFRNYLGCQAEAWWGIGCHKDNMHSEEKAKGYGRSLVDVLENLSTLSGCVTGGGYDDSLRMCKPEEEIKKVSKYIHTHMHMYVHTGSSCN